jgi:hypothetical protein
MLFHSNQYGSYNSKKKCDKVGKLTSLLERSSFLEET